MKIKTLYIYLAGLVTVFTLLLFFSTGSNNDEQEITESVQQQMPQDEIHKGMQSDNGAPNETNVNENAMQKMLALKKEVEKNPSDTMKVREYADFLGMAHKPNEAIDLYSSILENDPGRIDLYLKLTFLYYNLGQIDKAEEATNKALDVDPGNLDVQYNSGVIAAAKGDKATAKKIWLEIKEKHPGTRAAGFAEQSLRRMK